RRLPACKQIVADALYMTRSTFQPAQAVRELQGPRKATFDVVGIEQLVANLAYRILQAFALPLKLNHPVTRQSAREAVMYEFKNRLHLGTQPLHRCIIKALGRVGRVQLPAVQTQQVIDSVQ